MRLVSILFVVILSRRGLAHGVRQLKEDKTSWPTPSPSREPTLTPTPHPTLIQTYEPSAEAIQINSPSIPIDSDSNDSSPTIAPVTSSDDLMFVDLPEMSLSLMMPDAAAQALDTASLSTHVVNFINSAFRAEFDTTSFRFSHAEVLVLPAITNGTRRERRLQSSGETVTSIGFLLSDGKAAFKGFPIPSGNLLNSLLGKLFANDELASNQFWNFFDSLKESNDDALSQVLAFDFLIHVDEVEEVAVSESEEDIIPGQDEDDLIFVNLPEMSLSLLMPDAAAQSLDTASVSTHVVNFVNSAFRAEFDATSFRFSHAEVLVLPTITNGTRRERLLQSLGETVTSIGFLLSDGKAAFKGFPIPSGDLLTYFLGKLFANDELASNQFWNFGHSLKKSDDALSQVVAFDFLIHVENLSASESEEDIIPVQDEEEEEEGSNTKAEVAGVDPATEEPNASTSSRRKDVILGTLVGVVAAAVVIGGAFLVTRKGRRSKGRPNRQRVYSEEVEGDIYSTNTSSDVPVGEEESWAGLTVEDSMRLSPGSGMAERWASIHDGSAPMPSYDARNLEKIISMSNAVVSNSTDQAKT